MPKGNGTGPGGGAGMGRKGGMGGGRAGAGLGGDCLCPQCGAQVPHQQGKPCFNMICTKCGSQMMRGR